MAMCEDTVRKIRTGEIADPKQADAIFKGVAAFCHAYVSKLKHSPKQIALEEAARAAARRAAESMDLKQATEILQSRNFKRLEEAGGVIDITAQEQKADKVLKKVEHAERQTRKIIAAPVDPPAPARTRTNRTRTEIF